MTKICLILILICSPIIAIISAEPLYLQSKFKGAHSGDYIVTAQDNAYSLLRLRSLNSDVLVLEEVSIPSSQVNIKTIDWRTWFAEKAPGHTAWTLYEIDLKHGKILECFSCSKNGWIYLDEHEQFFAQLFALPFLSLPDAEKKRIGPPPASGETDHRRIWNPPLIIEGKKINHPLFDILHTRWPNDSSYLSSCDIDLYFDTANLSFPFPHWIEVKGSHYAFKVRTIDSGQDLPSPVILDMPRRPPLFTQHTEKTPTAWIIALHVPLYYDALDLYVIDLNSESHPSAIIPHHFKRLPEKECATLHVDTLELRKILKPDHRYQWALRSDKTPSVYVRSDEIFIWK